MGLIADLRSKNYSLKDKCIKEPPVKQRLKYLVASKPALQEILMEVLQAESK